MVSASPIVRQVRPSLETLEDRVVPALFSFAGFMFEQDSTPDVRGLLSPGTFSDAIVTAVPTTATGSVTFPDAPAVGFNGNLSLGAILNAGTRALNLPAGNDGAAARSGVELSWSGGRGLANLAGDDLVFYESGTVTPGSAEPEAFMIQVHNATTNTWSSWYYEPADAAAPYGGAGSAGAFATAVDLTNLGLGAGEIIDRIRLVNMTDEDRMVSATGIGAVIPEDNGATSANFPDPGTLASFANYGSLTLDPDPLYVGAFNALTSTLVDIAVSKTDGLTQAPLGTTVTYTITVSSNGPNAANGVTFTDVIPTQLSGVTWTSVASGGATGNTNGAGNINEVLNLPVGSTVVYTVTGQLLLTVTPNLVNTATVTVGAGVTDTNLANNTATDTDLIWFHPALPVTPKADLYTPHPNATPTVAFVAGLYNQVLGREGTPAEIDAWVQVLVNGATVESVVQGFVNSPEYRQKQVESYYQLYLNRTSIGDPGAVGWVNILLVTQNEAEVISGILVSPEYASAHVSNNSFATDLYLRILGRVPDAGIAGWQAALDNGQDRGSLVRDFLRTTESTTLAVEGFYVNYFHRTGDAFRQTWINTLSSNLLTFSQVAANFLSSQENKDRAALNVP